MRMLRTAVTMALALAITISASPAQAKGNEVEKTALPKGVVVHRFEYTVRSGPSVGLTLQGVLTFMVKPDGKINHGVLTLADGKTIRVTGQANGRSIALAFEAGDGNFIYG